MKSFNSKLHVNSSAILALAILGFCALKAEAVVVNATLLNPSGATFSYGWGAGGGQQAGYATTAGSSHAVTWTGTAASVQDLHPGGIYTNSYATNTDGTTQVGFATTSASLGTAQAMMWNGTPTAVVLHPSGYDNSQALGVDGGTQVGYGLNTSEAEYRALMWSGSAASVVDLKPTTPGWGSTFAIGAGGGMQSGFGLSPGSEFHALIWSGSGGSFVDINPAGSTESQAVTTNGTYHGGYALFGAAQDAILWNGNTAASYLNLAPGGGYSKSIINDLNGLGLQVGSAQIGTDRHALAWSGTAASFVDLNAAALALTFPTTVLGTNALGVDALGNIVGYAYDGPLDIDGNDTGNRYAVLWNLSADVNPGPGGGLPEPSTLLISAVGLLALARKRCRK